VQRPLVPAPSLPDSPPPEVPPSVADAEEAHLVWQWLQQPGARLLDASGPLSLPARAVVDL